MSGQLSLQGNYILSIIFVYTMYENKYICAYTIYKMQMLSVLCRIAKNTLFGTVFFGDFAHWVRASLHILFFLRKCEPILEIKSPRNDGFCG